MGAEYLVGAGFGALVGLLRRKRPWSRGMLGLAVLGAFLVPWLHSMLASWAAFVELWNDPRNFPALIALTLYRFGLPALIAGVALWVVVSVGLAVWQRRMREKA